MVLYCCVLWMFRHKNRPCFKDYAEIINT
ncbi:hypothetical protein DP116_24950 [Brasilonema bromeliae SPC951]|uniref:Uncharacterized protein n=1 Tax=Brasilonema bromeliae SPC951 TaxID=385972 RepID=A0ABX1PF07_9CYAN|nr:hypothetical protein [Brasilonema bromeliae SPC951]